MRHAAVATAAFSALLSCASARATELELTGYLGYTLPFYEQTFPIDLRPPGGAIQGIELRQVEPLRLNAKGGLTFAGGATLYFGPIGIEGRYDSADVDPTADPPVYSLRLSSPFPSVSTTLVPSPTEVDVSSLTPLSLNLKLRMGRVFGVSGGVSYLPDFDLAVRQPLNLRVGGAGLPALDLGAVTAEAISRPQDPSGDSRFGANAGLSLRLPLSDNAGLVVDARGFYFPEQVLEWRVTQTGGPITLPPAFLQSIEQQLEPVRFNPAYFHLQGGIALSF
jgi:hypothetical protein